MWNTPYGRLVATRVEHIHGDGRMEIRLTARLSADEGQAREQSQQLAVEIDKTVRRVFASPAPVRDLFGVQVTSRSGGAGRPPGVLEHRSGGLSSGKEPRSLNEDVTDRLPGAAISRPEAPPT